MRNGQEGQGGEGNLDPSLIDSNGVIVLNIQTKLDLLDLAFIRLDNATPSYRKTESKMHFMKTILISAMMSDVSKEINNTVLGHQQNCPTT